jgi:hypothetical protein
MKNFHFLFAAWIAVWAIFLFYEVSIARRIARLQDEVKSLRRQLQNE